MGVETYVPISDFYAGKSVFITGGAGYLGKVLLEKLLYSCPNVDNVYMLLRDKKNVSAEQRLQTIINLPIFARLRKERPQDLNKIVLLKGDIGSENLNMKTEDLKTVIEKVSVVIHSAATIKFNEPLKIALKINFEGTRNVLNLCHLMKNLRVFVHTSTAYSNTNKTVIEEMVYPPPVSIDEVYKFLEQEDPDEARTVEFLNGRPNTYTFTKALAEHLVSETHGNIPTVIIRPSIVTPSKDEPVKGWVDNWFGCTSLLTIISKGLCRVVLTSDEYILDIIPVDYVCNLTLIAAARTERQTKLVVYNSCSGSTNPITMKEIVKLYSQACVKNGCNDLPYPELMLRTTRPWLVKLITMLMFLFAQLADLFNQLTGNRPKFTKLVSQADTIRNMVEFFTSHFWILKTDNSQTLYDSLSPSDARQFPCLARDINWNAYIPIYFQGVKTYLMEKK